MAEKITNMINLNDALARARQASRLTQAEIARKSGLSRMAVQKIESGSTDPRLSSLLAIAQSMGMDLILVPVAIRQELEQFIQSGGRLLGQPPGVDAPLSIVDEILERGK